MHTRNINRRAGDRRLTCLCFRRVSTGLAAKVQSGLLVNTTNTSTGRPSARAQVMGRVQSVVPRELWGKEGRGEGEVEEDSGGEAEGKERRSGEEEGRRGGRGEEEGRGRGGREAGERQTGGLGEAERQGKQGKGRVGRGEAGSHD